MGFRLPVLQCFSDKSVSSDHQAITKAYSAEQVREMDRRAIESGSVNVPPIPGIHLMKRAGRGLLYLLLKRWPQTKRLCIFCGTGNNGGDGYIVAALAAQKNIRVCLIEIAPEKVHGDAALARQYAMKQGIEPVLATNWLASDKFSGQPSSDNWQDQHSVVVDALLGIGFAGELRPLYKNLIQQINQSGFPVIAADIASGLSADTGVVPEIAVKADISLTFIAMKTGLLTGNGREYSGDIYLDKLGVTDKPLWIPEEREIEVLEVNKLLSLLPEKRVDSHKGSNGHLVVIGGDMNYGGAVLMAAEAALRLGAGLVSVITRSEHRNAILARRPELMVIDAGEFEMVGKLLEKASSIVIGPGLGQGAWGQKLLQRALNSRTAKVIDADALNLLAKSNNPAFELHSTTLELNNTAVDILESAVLTPHPGEASRLLGKPIEYIQQDRLSATLQLQKKWRATILLKGSGTVIASSNKNQAQTRLSICPYGNPGMSSGGMGDVLSGVIGSLLAQGMALDEATRLGCALHSKAADMAAEKQGVRGLLATDLIDYFPRLINR